MPASKINLPSSQSLNWLHCNFELMQLPSSHLHWSSAQELRVGKRKNILISVSKSEKSVWCVCVTGTVYSRPSTKAADTTKHQIQKEQLLCHDELSSSDSVQIYTIRKRPDLSLDRESEGEQEKRTREQFRKEPERCEQLFEQRTIKS